MIGTGLATTYNCSIAITHGADLICLTGICNFTFPKNPAFITTGSPKCLRASFFNGKFSSSTFPENKNSIKKCESSYLEYITIFFVLNNKIQKSKDHFYYIPDKRAILSWSVLRCTYFPK